MWARVHKIDRIRPLPTGGAVVLVEDERKAAAMMRVPPLSVLIATARILNARRVIETRYGGKGEVRYAASASPPSPLLDAILRAGAAVSDGAGERVLVPASTPAGLSAVIDAAFAELAHHVRTSSMAADMGAALRAAEATRRKAPLEREANPALYWTAVFELSALAGELSRPKGGRWVETAEMPVPFAIRFPGGEVAAPAKLAQRIAQGEDPLESMATEVEPLVSPPTDQ